MNLNARGTIHPPDKSGGILYPLTPRYKDNMKYAYEMGNCNGGQWISLQEYQHKESCKWQYVTARGICNGVEAFLKRYKAAMTDKQALIDAIEKGMEGFKIVPDEMGVDAPLLMYNENQIVDGAGLTFDEKWKRIGKMGDIWNRN